MEYSTEIYHEFKQFIGNRIEHFRTQKNLSEAELAEFCYLRTNRIFKFEQGKGNPSLHSLFRICCALDVDPEVIFGYQLPDEEGKRYNEAVTGYPRPTEADS